MLKSNIVKVIKNITDFQNFKFDKLKDMVTQFLASSYREWCVLAKVIFDFPSS